MLGDRLSSPPQVPATFAVTRVETDRGLEALDTVPISIQCWQSHDVLAVFPTKQSHNLRLSGSRYGERFF